MSIAHHATDVVIAATEDLVDERHVSRTERDPPTHQVVNHVGVGQQARPCRRPGKGCGDGLLNVRDPIGNRYRPGVGRSALPCTALEKMRKGARGAPAASTEGGEAPPLLRGSTAGATRRSRRQALRSQRRARHNASRSGHPPQPTVHGDRRPAVAVRRPLPQAGGHDALFRTGSPPPLRRRPSPRAEQREGGQTQEGSQLGGRGEVRRGGGPAVLRDGSETGHV